jgi:hypothetical protein
MTASCLVISLATSSGVPSQSTQLPEESNLSVQLEAAQVVLENVGATMLVREPHPDYWVETPWTA